ncbi:MAG: 6-bladed beta-propeller [Chloroflexota bacterium]
MYYPPKKRLWSHIMHNRIVYAFTISVASMLLLGMGFTILHSQSMFAATSMEPLLNQTQFSKSSPDIFRPLSTNADPLPPGCPHVSPPGEEITACCINGFVYMDNEPISGATVLIQTSNGVTRTVRTQRPSNQSIDQRPYYGLRLSDAPLNVQAGETITIMASFADRTTSLSYEVQAGQQEVNLALAGNNVAGNYAYDDEIWKQAAEGRLLKPHGIAIDQTDRAFVVDRENQRIQVFDAQGQFIRQWGTKGHENGQFYNPFGIALDGSNNVYVADSGNHRIQKFGPTGQHLQTWGEYGIQDGQFDTPEGIAVDQDGNIYVADSANHRIQKLGPDGKFISTWGTVGAADGQFDYPTAMAIDSQNNLYVVDYLNHRIQKFDRNGNHLPGWGQLGDCNAPNGCSNGDFRRPDGIAIDNDDNVFVSDTNHRMQKFTSDGTWLDAVGTRGIGQAQFDFPKGLAVDGGNNLYVVDEGNSRVQQFDSNLTWQRDWGNTADNAQQLVSPMGSVFDRSGNLYVADSEANRIQIFDRDGNWLRNIDTTKPSDVTFDASGNLYVVDQEQHRVVKFDALGTFVTFWGGEGSGNGQFNLPYALAVSPAQELFVVDKFNHRIQVFDLSGNWLRSWGSQGLQNTQFNGPEDLAISSQGQVYVADTFNDRIQIFDSQGGYLGTIGGPGGGNGQFAKVTSIAIDAFDNLFAVDRSHQVQKFSATGQWLATWGTNGVQAGQFGRNLRVTVGPDERIYVSDTDTNRIQIFKAERDGQPIATITSVLPSRSLNPDDELEMYGLGQDSDATQGIVAYRWFSDRDGELSTARILVRLAKDLTSGTHIISLQVQDDEGNWSAPATKHIHVAPQPDHSWTMLLYFAGDYHDYGNLFDKFSDAIERLKQTHQNPHATIAILFDGPSNNDTDRFTLTFDPATQTTSWEKEDRPEAEMDDPQTLIDFIKWGQQTYPAKNYYLSIANHGQAIHGIAWDNSSDVTHQRAHLDSNLSVQELGQALNSPEIEDISILHLDACSMNLVETVYEIQGQVRYLISSQYLGWDYFAYEQYAPLLNNQSDLGPIVKQIVDIYGNLAKADNHPHTISALDIQRASTTLVGIDDLTKELHARILDEPESVSALQTIWSATQKFESDGDYLISELDAYIDLVDWVQRIQDSPELADGAVATRAETLLSELARLIVANRAYSANLPDAYGNGAYIDLEEANGISIFYPATQADPAFNQYGEHGIFAASRSSIWGAFLKEAIQLSGNPEDRTKPLAHLEAEQDETPEETPTAQPTAEPSATSTATSTSTATVGPTASPEATTTPTPTSIQTEAPATAETPTAVATEPTPTATTTPTATSSGTSPIPPESTEKPASENKLFLPLLTNR